MKAITFSLLCLVLFSPTEILSQVTGTGSDPCMGYSGCTTSCPEESLKNCKDPQRYINGVCKTNTRGCICKPGLIGATCNSYCVRGKYGIACKKQCSCNDNVCDKATGCPDLPTTRRISSSLTSTVRWLTHSSPTTKFTRQPLTTTFTQQSTSTRLTKQPLSTKFTKQPPITYDRDTTIKTSTVLSTKNLTHDVGINENDGPGFPMSTHILIIIIVSTVIVIVGVISLCLIVRKYRLNKSITKHLERAQDNSVTQLFSDGTRTRSGNDYEGIDTRFENTENMQVDSTYEQVVNGYLYVEINLGNNTPNAEPNNQPITIDNYTEIRDADLNRTAEENAQVATSPEQIVSSYSYIDIHLEKEPQNSQRNDQVLTIDNYMEIRDEDLNQAQEVSLTQSYMSPNDITEIPPFFKPANAYTVVSDLRQIISGISDIPKILNKQEEVYNILNRTPKQARHFDTNYDHVTPNDELYNDLNFTLK
ncbi:uncharacterized protein LOC143082589 [Mytilus galloprovincialis]|uniref:uncharacterized protein LOC143082589 n=1 Tax=Mytilus galloprovincialis TaxID=29158 RepID=UPI003F7C8F5C